MFDVWESIPVSALSYLTPLFLLKLLLMPPLIGGVTLAARRWGAGVGGWLGGFPWVAGPISVFLAVEQGPAFAAASTVGALAGSVGTLCFAFVYASVAQRVGWLPSVLLSYAAYFSVAAGSQYVPLTLPLAFVLNLSALSLILWKFPRPAVPLVAAPPPTFDIPLRMAVATLFVVVLTQVAQVLGADWSGLLTPFPILTSTLAVFTHIQQGPAQSARMVRGILTAGYGFATFLALVGYLLPRWGVSLAYGTAIVVAAVINLAVFRYLR
jgi:hypothetical protein